MSLEERSIWERLDRWGNGPWKSAVGAALIALDVVFFNTWFAVALGVLLIACDVWERSPRGKRAALRERLRQLDGKSTEGFTLGYATFLFCLACGYYLYYGGPAGWAKGFVEAWSDVLPELEEKRAKSLMLLEVAAWLSLGVATLFISVFWLGRLLGYAEKGDTFEDLMSNVFRAMSPGLWTKAFIRQQLQFGPKTYAEIRYAATLASIDNPAVQQARSDLGVKTHKQGRDWIWTLPPDA